MSNVFCCSCFPHQEQNEISNIMEEVTDMDHVDALIAYIDQLISKIDTGSQEQVQRPSSVDSGGNIIGKLSRALRWHISKKCFLSALDRETGKVVVNVLNQAQAFPYLGMAFSVIAHVLERAEQTSSNECLRLQRDMSVLAKHMKNLDIHLDRNKLKQILLFIVKGTLMCARQMEPEGFSRFISAPPDAADLEKLKTELLRLYPDLQLLALTEVLNRLPTYPEPSQGEPDDAVGIQEAQNKVIGLLDVKNSSRRTVVIYGVGGIGKTTLATSVYSSLDLTGYNHCRVVMDQDSSKNDLKAIQEQILHDLFNKNLKLNNSNEGREKLKEAFGKASEPVFLFIDNALRKNDLKELLPIEHLSNLPMRSRIFATTRNFDETRIFCSPGGTEVHSYRVAPLSEPEAKRLLCHYALGDKNGCFHPDVNIDGLLQVCEGIPLVLQIVGSKLSRNVLACNEILEYLKRWKQKGCEGGEEDLSETIVDFVYRRLRESSKEAFLDIVFFFYDWERSRVSDIVGEIELQDLEAASLVTTSEETEHEMDMHVKRTKVKMHDIVRARGRKLSEGNRITDRESFSFLLSDEQKLQQTKGIWLPNEREEISVEAKHLDLMSRCLRVLSLGEANKHYLRQDSKIRINGRCERVFEDLRFLHMWFVDMLPLDPSKTRQLVYFEGHFMKERGTSEAKLTINLPDSLRLLYLYAYIPVSLDIYGRLPPLRELQLENFTSEKLQTCIGVGNFTSLKILKLTDTKLETLPESFGNLPFLQTLIMGRIHLRRLPESFGNLSSLQRLFMQNCSMLERLPESFGNLTSLEILAMVGWQKMYTLSDNFVQLKCLKFLNISNCKELKSLPEDIVCLTSLTVLRAYGCADLEAKAMDRLVEINSLLFLEMGESPMLIKRWEEIRQHRPLIGAALRLERDNFPHAEIMSTMLFNDGSRFLQLDGEGQLVEMASCSFPEVGVEVKMGLLLTACRLSNQVRQKLVEVASEFQIIYVDVELEAEAEAETSSWMEERKKRIKETLLQLPEGARVWTSRFRKTTLLLAYSLWDLSETADTSIVGTSVMVDGEGRRKLSPLEMIFRSDVSHSPRMDLETLLSPLSEALEFLDY